MTMNGLQVTRHLKADPVTCEIPVIAVTAPAMIGDEEKTRATGRVGYIYRPFLARDFYS